MDGSSHSIAQLTRLLKLEQAYSATLKEETASRVLDVEAAMKRLQEEHNCSQEEQRRQSEERDEVERRERAERQQREAQMQSVLLDIEERLSALQRQADDDRRQREQNRREAEDSRQQTDERVTAVTHRMDDTGRRMEALVRMLAVLDERNRADDERRAQSEQQWQLDAASAREQQRAQLLKCAAELRAFQLSIRDEMGRRERQAEAVKRAVLVMSEEVDRGGGGAASDEVRRWREAERREREERDERRRRAEMDKLRDDVFHYVDARVGSLPQPPPPPAAHTHHTRPTSAYERPQRADAPRDAALHDGRWVERSMEQLSQQLAAERGRAARTKPAVDRPTERGGHSDGMRAGTTAAAMTQAGYRTNGAAAIDARQQRGAAQNGKRTTRFAGVGR